MPVGRLSQSPSPAATRGPRLAMVAGEASGDLLAALMLAGLRRHWPGVEAFGIGGSMMAEQGFESWAAAERLSVFGYVNAIKRLPELLWLRGAARRRIVRLQPDAFVGIDAPDFNFGLETSLRRQGVRTLHFVCPSIWAWRAHRVARLRQAADHVLCLFPFEPALLASHGIPATFVGHPLADAIELHPSQQSARERLGLSPSAGPWVALLPGSRRAEIRHIAPLLVAAAEQMLTRRPELRFLLPCAPGLMQEVQPLVKGLLDRGLLTLLVGQSHDVLAAADVALVASGTATLEAALFKCPMVVVYRLAAADWSRMRRMRLQPWVGLPNILSGEFIVPERLQDDARPQTLASDVLAWLEDAARVARYRERCGNLHEQLRQDTGAKSAQVLRELLSA